jgi:hypothetical protein
MRSTNKIVVNRIRHSINTSIETNFTASDVLEAFEQWYGPYEQKRTPNRQAAFIEWLRCLPNIIDIPFSDYDIQNTLDTWLEGVPNNRQTPLDSTALWNKMGWLLYRELNKMIKEDKSC